MARNSRGVVLATTLGANSVSGEFDSGQCLSVYSG